MKLRHRAKRDFSGLSHVALAAIQSGQEVIWDPAAHRYTSPTSLNSSLAKPMRGRWLDASEPT